MCNEITVTSENVNDYKGGCIRIFSVKSLGHFGALHVFDVHNV